MAIFPMSCVLRDFLPSTYFKYAEGKKPCAAELIKKIPYLWMETSFKLSGSSDIKPLELHNVSKTKM